MNRNVNRAEQLWNNWEEKQKQLQGLSGLGEESSQAIKQRKYDFLREGLYRISASPTEKEQLHIHAIRSVTDKLQKQLYPNPVVRLLHRLKAFVYDKPAHLRQFNKQRAENLESLKGQLKASGFASFNGKLEIYLDYETPKVHIPITSQLNDKGRLDITLNMERDNFGHYHFSQYQATVLRDGESRSFNFQPESKITAMEAANLLDGRAVRKSLETADGSYSQKWVQLDFKNRDADGHPKLQEFHEGYAYDLKNELLKLSVQVGVAGLAKDKVIQSLEAGNMAVFEVRDKGPYYLQANPAEQNLSLFDKDRKPLETVRLLKEIRQPDKNLHKAIHLVKSQEKEPEQEQRQSFGIR